MVARPSRALLGLTVGTCLGFAAVCLVLLHSCSDRDQVRAQGAQGADVVHLLDLPRVVDQGAVKSNLPDELFGPEALWIINHMIPEGRWTPDLSNKGFEIVRLPIPIAGEAQVHAAGNRVHRGGLSPLKAEPPLPAAGELVLVGDRLRRREGEPLPPPVTVEFPIAPGALAEFMGIGRSEGLAAISELKLGVDCRRARVLRTPADLVIQVDLPQAARLDFAVAARAQELLFSQAGTRLRPVVPGRFPAVQVLLELEDGTSVQLWERSLSVEDRDSYLDTRLDLSAWSGQTVRLHFQSTASGAADGDPWQSFVAWAEPVLWSAKPSHRPNILVLLCDTLRADRLGSYGWERARTPNLDGLAASGVRYRDMTSAASWTLPSHASIFTSTYPSQHGLWKDQRLPDELRTVAEVLRDGGYRTAAFAELGFLRPAHGFARGFEVFDSQRRDCTKTFELAATWMEAQETPFFAFVQTYKVHAPYDPASRFSEGYVREYAGEQSGVELMGEIAKATEGPPPSDEDMRFLSDLYDAEVAELDSAIGELLRRLHDGGLLENTLLVITSDHGEEFYEHGGVGHGMSFYQEQLHVPLIMKWPGRLEGGVVLTHPVHGVDLAPTLVEAAELEAPESWVGHPLGREPLARSRELFVPMRVRWARPERMGEEAAALRIGDLKYVDYPTGLRRHDEQGEPGLFDLQADPQEHKNLLDRENALLWAERVAEMRRQFHGLGEAGSAGSDEQTRQDLSELGYAGSE